MFVYLENKISVTRRPDLEKYYIVVIKCMELLEENVRCREMFN